MSAIEIKDLYKEFSVPGGTEVAVNKVDLTIGEQEFFTLVGPSGCGKTTTLRCIAGLETPTSGTIRFGSTDLTEIPPNKRNIAMMFQNIALYPHMSIEDNISYPLKVRNVDSEEKRSQAREAAEIMQIPELLDKRPAELSGGQRQRAALARTIVQDPRAFLMDEPLSDLDAQLKVQMRKEIQRIHKRVQKPTVYVTHDQSEAMTMSDRIAVMNDGEVEQVGTPDELYDQPKNQFVAEFIGSPSMNFIMCEVVDKGSSVQFESSEGRFTLDIDKTRIPKHINQVTVGFRPQSVQIGSDDGFFTGTVTIVERLDDRLLLTIESHGKELQATAPTSLDIEESETVDISFDQSKVHLFDSETSQALY